MGGASASMIEQLLRAQGQLGGQGGMPGQPPQPQVPGATGTLSMLPRSHQQAAMAPPPLPGNGQPLGQFTQQALGLAGIPADRMQQPNTGAIAPGGGMPPSRIPPGNLGKGSPLGGIIQRIPGLLDRMR